MCILSIMKYYCAVTIVLYHINKFVSQTYPQFCVFSVTTYASFTCSCIAQQLVVFAKMCNPNIV